MAIERDAQAFEMVMAAMKLVKDTPEQILERELALESATQHAARVPLEVARQAVEVLKLASQVVAQGNLNAISDGATGAALARAALTGAGYNVRVNVASLKDPLACQFLLEELGGLESQAAEIEHQIQTDLSSRGGISL
jgi:formiminotetrahydrofolate cyclodeaminase